MKRSEINAVIDEVAAFAKKCGFHLPPFAFFKPADWREKKSDYEEIRDAMLGWDVTDFGCGDFKRRGLTAFTLRNGGASGKRYPKPYAEKLLVSYEGQVTPYHFHWNKMEDIINRGGGNLCVQLFNSTAQEGFDEQTEVSVSVDGRLCRLPAGGIVTLRPGESICLTPGLYHQFWAEENSGMALLGEVSMHNDDNNDNRFWDASSRFSPIEEDAEPAYLLCNEYP